MNQINKKHFYQRMKERVLSILVASREAYKVKIKIKWEYVPFKVSKEETKEYWKSIQNKWIITIIMKKNWNKKNKKSLIKKRASYKKHERLKDNSTNVDWK